MQPLSKAKLKVFASLGDKRMRRRHGLFVAEGRKLVHEALASQLGVEALIGAEGFEPSSLPATAAGVPFYQTSRFDYEALSDQVSPEGVMAILRLPPWATRTEAAPVAHCPAFLLHDVQDPGNLGTLLRTADWFGFGAVYCSVGTVDCYGPKVVRAAMGAVFRVPVYYIADFEAFVHRHAAKIICSQLGGPALAGSLPRGRHWVLLGAEAHGLPPALALAPGLQCVEIPGRGHADSLNVAVAGGILAWWVTQDSFNKKCPRL